MLEFAQIWAFALLPLPAIVAWLAPPRREAVRAVRVPFFGDIAEASGQQAKPGSAILSKTWGQTGFASLVWILLILALARPEWAGEPIEKTESARDIMLAIDLSGSMDQRDFAPEGGKPLQRLDAVKQVVGGFIKSRDGDRVGLIVFGTKPYVLVPFTRDLETVSALLAATEVGMAGPHTALGDAIGLAIRTFEVSEVDQRQLIVLTDGADTGSRMTPVNAAEIARQKGVTIFTIGVGDPNGTGENRVDYDTLRDVARRADGLFFEATDAEGLARVYERIDEALPRTVKIISYRPKQALTFLPAGTALILCLIVGLFSFFRRRSTTIEMAEV